MISISTTLGDSNYHFWIKQYSETLYTITPLLSDDDADIIEMIDNDVGDRWAFYIDNEFIIHSPPKTDFINALDVMHWFINNETQE